MGSLKDLVYKAFSLLSVVRGYNILVLIIAQYLAAAFIFTYPKSLLTVLLDKSFFLIVLATVFVVASGYIINSFYDVKIDRINRPFKTKLDNEISQQTRLNIYFLFNFLAVFLGWLVSFRAAFFFSVYIFLIWFYSHKLKKYPFVGLLSATILTILPFFAIFVYYKNFSKIIFVHAFFLFLMLLIRELIKDLENIKGAIVGDYTTFPVKYGELNTKKVVVLLFFLIAVPIAILLNHPTIGYMRYYFYVVVLVLFLVVVRLWFSNAKGQYVFLHNVIKLLLLTGVFSLPFIDTSLLIEKVIEQLY